MLSDLRQNAPYQSNYLYQKRMHLENGPTEHRTAPSLSLLTNKFAIVSQEIMSNGETLMFLQYLHIILLFNCEMRNNQG